MNSTGTKEGVGISEIARGQKKSTYGGGNCPLCDVQSEDCMKRPCEGVNPHECTLGGTKNINWNFYKDYYVTDES